MGQDVLRDEEQKVMEIGLPMGLLCTTVPLSTRVGMRAGKGESSKKERKRKKHAKEVHQLPGRWGGGKKGPTIRQGNALPTGARNHTSKHRNG